MRKEELSSEEYRKIVKREKIRNCIRSAIIILAFLGLFVFVILVGEYMFTHDYSMTRTVIVCVAAFFVYCITAGCLFIAIAMLQFYIHDADITRGHLTQSDIRLIVYLLLVTTVMIGGSNALFWIFAFR